MKNLSKIHLLIFATILFGQIASAQSSGFIVKIDPNDQLAGYNFTYQKNAVLKDTITVRSLNKDTPISIHLSGVDALTNEIGQSYFKNDSDTQKNLGLWIKISQPDITLQPLETKEIDFTVNPPADAVPGDYIGGISVQGADVAPITTTVQQTSSFSVKVATRVVKNVFLEIPGQKVSDGDISNFAFNQDSHGGKYFDFNIKNTGNTLLDFEGNIIIDGGLDKKTSINIPIYIKSVQSGVELPEHITWPNSSNLWGNFNAQLNLTAKEYNPFKEKLYDVKKYNLTTSLQLVPWNYIIISIAALILIIISIIIVVVSKRNYLKHCEYYEIKDGDNLKTLAETHGMTWQKLVKINKLSPPYELKPNSKILVRKIDEKK